VLGEKQKNPADFLFHSKKDWTKEIFSREIFFEIY